MSSKKMPPQFLEYLKKKDAKKEDEQGPTVDMSSPIQMLKTFSAQQKSAFTQEAKALDDKAKTQSELTLADQEMIKAKEQASKASNTTPLAKALDPCVFMRPPQTGACSIFRVAKTPSGRPS